MSMSLDEFLGHKSSSHDGGKVLRWRKRNPAQLTTWLHTKSPFVALWRHGWPRVVEVERDGEKVSEVWGGQWNCHETEEVLRKQYRRGPDGARALPPTKCPLCMMIEWVRTEVEADRMSWVEPIFEFKGDDPEQTLVLNAAGLYNGFGGDRLTRAELADLRSAGIRRDEAWKQAAMAKCAYVFDVVDHDEPTELHVCIETTALGDAVKRVIRDQIDALGETDGNPLRVPYAIRWEYHPEQKEFSKKYRALALPRHELTPEVRALIVDSPPSDISGLIRPGDVAELRASMESAALIDLPFDRFFGSSSQTTSGGRSNRRAEPKREPEPEPEPEQPRRRRATKPAEPEEPQPPAYPPGTVMLPCDSCGADMAETDAVCWKCGAKYELDDDAPKAKPAPKSSKAVDSVDEDDIPW